MCLDIGNTIKDTFILNSSRCQPEVNEGSNISKSLIVVHKKEEAMIKYKVTLTKEERAESEEISSKGSHKSQKVLNALILMNCDEGEFQVNRSRNTDGENN